jgi:hypothetical protein
MINEQELSLPFDGGVADGLLVYAHRVAVWATFVFWNLVALGLFFIAVRFPLFAGGIAATLAAAYTTYLALSFAYRSLTSEGLSGARIELLEGARRLLEVRPAFTVKRRRGTSVEVCLVVWSSTKPPGLGLPEGTRVRWWSETPPGLPPWAPVTQGDSQPKFGSEPCGG